MNEPAVLLPGRGGPALADRVERLLDFFGLAASRLAPEDLQRGSGQTGARVFCAADAFVGLLEWRETAATAPPGWWARLHSVFVYPGEDPDALIEAARHVAGVDGVAYADADPPGPWQVCDSDEAVCGAMSGVAVASSEPRQAVFALEGQRGPGVALLSRGSTAAFIRGDLGGVPVFLTSVNPLDVRAPLDGEVFDVRRHALSAVPPVMYVTWAFDASCWRPAETGACVVIDDPLLRLRYGHIDFAWLFETLRRLDFSISLAFIPWNCRRSDREAVALFAGHPDRASISIHGCDHTGGEYGERDAERLAARSRDALERMAQLEGLTGLPFDRVMVFPQGVFSSAAPGALARAGFLAAVNNDVVSCDVPPSAVRVCDYWDVAVMNYGAFPIFTRRHPSEGLENFAFDVLLGKPCLGVLHQGDFCGNGRQVEAFVESLHRLNAHLEWSSLATVARRAVRRKRAADGSLDVEYYASTCSVTNATAGDVTARFARRAPDPNAISAIHVDGKPVEWTHGSGRVGFESCIGAGKQTDVTMATHSTPPAARAREPLRARAAVAARRYACEVRDNYLKPATAW